MTGGLSTRSASRIICLVGAALFLLAFTALIFRHLDSWHVPPRFKSPPADAPVKTDEPTISEPTLPNDNNGNAARPNPALFEPDNAASQVPKPQAPKPPIYNPQVSKSSPPAAFQSSDTNPVKPETGAHGFTPLTPPGDGPATDSASDLVNFLTKKIWKPTISPDKSEYRPFGAFSWNLPGEAKIKSSMGEKLCIIDLDNRPFNGSGEIFGPSTMSWDRANSVHGLSAGILNHWLYAKIHGYKYYYVAIDTPADRRASWKKPAIISKILKEHDVCLYLDSDAIFYRLDLPFEWLLNYWQLWPSRNSLALALDPLADNNKDKFGKIYLNTGFIVAQNNAKTFEIMKAWEHCPDNKGPFPGCAEFRTNSPGRPTDQGGFGTYVRYKYRDSIKDLLCDEANGFPESHSGCGGKFIRHLWTGKHDHIKVVVGQQVPGSFLKALHTQYIKEKDNFYLTEKDLLSKGAKGAFAPSSATTTASGQAKPKTASGFPWW